MRKLIIVVMALMLIAGAAGLKITNLEIVNNSEHELRVSLVPLELGYAPYYPSIPADLSGPDKVYRYYAIPSGQYSLTALGRVNKVDKNSGYIIEGEWVECFGNADSLLWDDFRAGRVIELLQGKRTIRFTQNSCQDVAPEVFNYWKNLSLKTFRYVTNKEQGYFEY